MGKLTKRDHKAGDFSVELISETPHAITDQIREWDSLLVAPVHVGADEMTRSQSIYSGVVRALDDRLTLGGAHINVWLGDEDGKANFPSAAIAPIYLIDWVNAILPYTPFVAGRVPAAGQGAALFSWVWGNEKYPTFRDLLDKIGTGGALTSSTPYGWWAGDDFTLNMAPVSEMQAAPTTVLSPQWGGRDAQWLGIRCDLGTGRDSEDYGTTVNLSYLNTANGDPAALAASVATPYVDPKGRPLVWKRVERSSEKLDTAAAQAIANQQVARFGKLREQFAVRTTQGYVMTDLQVGRPVWLHDDRVSVQASPAAIIAGTATQINFRGQEIWPQQHTVEAITTTTEHGHGYYTQRGNGAFLDITDYVITSAPSTTIEVSAPPRTLSESLRL